MPRAAGMGASRASRPTGLSLSLLALSLALHAGSAVAQGASPSSSPAYIWSFSNASSKSQVVQQTTDDPDLTSLRRSAGVGGLPPDTDATFKVAFAQWAQAFGYNLLPQVDTQAYANFVTNLRLLNRVNLDPTIPFWLGANQFAHLSRDQFAAQLLMRQQNTTAQGGTPARRRALAQQAGGRRATLPPRLRPEGVRRAQVGRQRRLLQQLPAALSWVQAGKVTAVHNQYGSNGGLGGCGACWAFATAAAIESAYLIDKNLTARDIPYLELSAEQLLDCCTSQDSNGTCVVSQGCNGGSNKEAANYAGSAQLRPASLYPYIRGNTTLGAATGTCMAGQLPQRGLQLAAPPVILNSSAAAIMQALIVGPVLIDISASADTFQSYSGGIYNSTDCSLQYTDHALLVVGYNQTGPNPYFILKNSFGTTWGEGGFMRIAMTNDPVNFPLGMCAMYSSPIQVVAQFRPGKDVFNAEPPMPPSPRPPPVPPPPPPVPPPAPPLHRWVSECDPGNQYGSRGFSWTVSAQYASRDLSSLTLTVSRNAACDSALPTSCCSSNVENLQLLIQGSACRTIGQVSVTSTLPNQPTIAAAFQGEDALDLTLMPPVDTNASMFNITLSLDTSRAGCANIGSFLRSPRPGNYQYAAYGSGGACCGTDWIVAGPFVAATPSSPTASPSPVFAPIPTPTPTPTPTSTPTHPTPIPTPTPTPAPSISLPAPPADAPTPGYTPAYPGLPCYPLSPYPGATYPAAPCYYPPSYSSPCYANPSTPAYPGWGGLPPGYYAPTYQMPCPAPAPSPPSVHATPPSPGAPLPPGGCSWYNSMQNTTSLSVKGNTSSCEACQAGCEMADQCYYFSWQGGVRNSFSNPTACGCSTGACGPGCACPAGAPCCSSSGYCGSNTEYCTNCQSKYSFNEVCVGTPTQAPTTSQGCATGACGPGCKCAASAPCCSPSGYCGADKDYCTADCQATYSYNGVCTAASAPSNNETQGCATGACGPGCNCAASAPCCSPSGYCGATAEYCTDCQDTYSFNKKCTVASGTQGNAVGGCSWYSDMQNTTRLPLNGNTSSCEACRDGCEGADMCYYFAWDGGIRYAFSNTTSCGQLIAR